ncbi:TetR/AcrR family transcriptional regulator [Paenibacillus polymyxa]|uniref:TetR/AcrR family transcriptional regulator n=1 Tax=Paenibacillus polymyxa TaxID=1406 RepID=UPI0005CDDDC8|nr:TetR/AcrR family transcriptional regulator [Paenibacillus polymyxa]KJD38064.1 TetR family transcriptional regulator [Paenibacillus polymyxa]MBY7740244.1 TetR/AcrR family transcriptional regulator [Paenibacillus polymyxa]MEE4581037.1 TetR/AcrR family transcriptional regulator [Paenibacillus polymyxa]
MFKNYNKVQQAILETTLNIIIRKELQATSMSLIAKESGVSTGNIYHYFKSKEDIVNELYKAIVTFNGEYVREGLLKGTTIREKFEFGWNRVIELGKQYPQGFQFIEQYSFSPYIYEEVKQEVYTGGWCALMNELYQEAIQEKLFIPMNPKMMVQMHYGTFVYMLKAHLHGIFELSSESVSGAIRLCWNAVTLRDLT